jgi:hypothetical protein
MSVLSHIVLQRLPGETENVATEALAFILNRSDGARAGITKLLRGLAPDLPNLEFTTQTAIDGGRPDLTASDGTTPLVHLESKFWAGLTENQPVTYLRDLATTARNRGVLLVIGPTSRTTSLWQELIRRLQIADIHWVETPSPPGVNRAVTTALRPTLAITAWPQLLTALELEATTDPTTQADIAQLRALCQTSDQAAWKPLHAEALTNQDTPALILQLGALANEVVTHGVARGTMNVTGLTAAATGERIGRYTLLVDVQAGVWIGTHFQLWRDHAATPMWLTCAATDWGRATHYKPRVMSWARSANHPFEPLGAGGFAVGLHLPTSTEMPGVIDAVLGQIGDMTAAMQDPGTLRDLTG